MKKNQCKAITKKNQRCKRLVSGENEFCSLHKITDALRKRKLENTFSVTNIILSLLALITAFLVLILEWHSNKGIFNKEKIELKIGLRYGGFFVKVNNTGTKDIENLKLRMILWAVHAPEISMDTIINVGLFPSKMILDIPLRPYVGYELIDWPDSIKNQRGRVSGLIIPYYKNSKGDNTLAYYLPGDSEWDDYQLFYNVNYNEQRNWIEYPSVECSFPDNYPRPTMAVNYPDVFDEGAWIPKICPKYNITGKWVLIEAVENPNLGYEEEFLYGYSSFDKRWNKWTHISRKSSLVIDTVKSEFIQISDAGTEIRNFRKEGNRLLFLKPGADFYSWYGRDYTVCATEVYHDTLLVTYSKYSNPLYIKEKYVRD